jgi:ABC-type polysaccharide/polyol phosphate export permease
MIKSFMKLNRELWNERKVVLALGKAEFKNEYVGSALGVLWGIIKPFTMILVYTIVFTNDVDGVPYYIWLIPGLFLWMFLSDALVGGTNAIRGNAHLVKKVVFPVSILPAAKIFSILINHLIFMVIAFVIMFFARVPLGWGTLQIFYYLFASILLSIGLTRLLSAMAVIAVDVVHFITTIMQILLWVSPVLWGGNDAQKPMLQAILPFLKLNPYYYLIEGYRNSFFNPSVRFYDDVALMVWFWFFTVVIFLLGSYYYDKNRPYFADVL